MKQSYYNMYNTSKSISVPYQRALIKKLIMDYLDKMNTIQLVCMLESCIGEIGDLESESISESICEAPTLNDLLKIIDDEKKVI